MSPLTLEGTVSPVAPALGVTGVLGAGEGGAGDCGREVGVDGVAGAVDVATILNFAFMPYFCSLKQGIRGQINKLSLHNTDAPFCSRKALSCSTDARIFSFCRTSVAVGKMSCPPALDERVRLRRRLQDLCLQLLLRGKKTVPQVVANGTLLKEVLKSGFVLAYAHNPCDVCHGTSQQRGLEQWFRSRWVGLLEEGYIDIALDVAGEVWFNNFVCALWSVAIGEYDECLEHTGCVPLVEGAEDPETAEYNKYVEKGNSERGHRRERRRARRWWLERRTERDVNGVDETE